MNKPSSLIFKTLAVLLLAQPAHRANAESLWKDTSAQSIFADKKARAVGDILTILVQESATAQKQNNTTTSKQSAIDASIQSFLYAPAASGLLSKNGSLPAMKMSSKNDFNGGGQINNSEQITARIAVRVIDVLPNGNLIVEGRRQTAFSGEKQDATLRGTVRYNDIAANNTLYSYNMVDATIQFTSKGTISDNQRKGWFSKIWDKVTPF